MFTDQEVADLIDRAVQKAFDRFKENKFQDAEVILKQVLRVNPDCPQAVQLLGLVYHNAGKFTEAADQFTKSLALNPGNVENRNNLALCLAQAGQFDEAIRLLEEAVAMKPDAPYLHSNLGLQYRQGGQTDRAIETFKAALALKEDPHTWAMLGGCYGEKRLMDEAEACFKRSVEIDPDFAPGHVDLASIYQLRGDWEKAWPEYEYRFQVYEQVKFWRSIYEPAKAWDGSGDIAGKRILVHSEQGSGDAIHFYRYVKLLRERGAYVILHVYDSLAPLFEADEIYTVDPTLIPAFAHRDESFRMPEYDLHASILSLPYLLKNPPIPAPPYIFVPGRIDTTEYRSCLRVGIVWAGNPQHPNDIQRSVRLANFRPIHDIPGVKLFSLQKDTRPRAYRFAPGPIDLTAGSDGMRLVDAVPFMTDYAGTAAVIQSLDLLISVDTAVLHLAGALNRPAWGLIPWNADWRWTHDGETTEWYPSVRLFRQPSLGDWASVFSHVTQELQKWK